MPDKKSLPWWLEGGGETCPSCGQSYCYEMERRCVYCDGPVCPWCHVSGDPDICCPECISCPEGDDW